MSSTDTLVANAERYAASFDKGDLPLPPALHVLVVACMDARLNPYGVLGLSEGDAHVVRNAGGVVSDDVIRSITISQRLLGTTEIILIHHTGCGMLTFHDDDVKSQIEADTGLDRRSPWRPSPTSTRTFASRSPGSRPARTSRTRTRCAALSTRSRPAACARSRTDRGRAVSRHTVGMDPCHPVGMEEFAVTEVTAEDHSSAVPTRQ